MIAVTPLLVGVAGPYVQLMGVFNMRIEADYSKSTKAMMSELATLSSDPSLSFRPDPGFQAKFRNPDELVEAESSNVKAGMRTVTAISATWACAAAWRRSPKD